MAEDFVQIRDTFPRATLALVFFPNDVAQVAPEGFGRRRDIGPHGIALLGSGHDGPLAAEIIAPIVNFALRGVVEPLVTFHGRIMARDKTKNKRLFNTRNPWRNERWR